MITQRIARPEFKRYTRLEGEKEEREHYPCQSQPQRRPEHLSAIMLLIQFHPLACEPRREQEKDQHPHDADDDEIKLHHQAHKNNAHYGQRHEIKRNGLSG